MAAASLLVMARPTADDDLVESIRICLGGSEVAPNLDCVRVRHFSVTGRDDAVERPAVEAVPLFWRFTREKWGIEPKR